MMNLLVDVFDCLFDDCGDHRQSDEENQILVGHSVTIYFQHNITQVKNRMQFFSVYFFFLEKFKLKKKQKEKLKKTNLMIHFSRRCGR